VIALTNTSNLRQKSTASNTGFSQPVVMLKYSKLIKGHNWTIIVIVGLANICRHAAKCGAFCDADEAESRGTLAAKPPISAN
jgi:hypothetical protein